MAEETSLSRRSRHAGHHHSVDEREIESQIAGRLPLDGDMLEALMRRILDQNPRAHRRVRFLGVFPSDQVPATVIRELSASEGVQHQRHAPRDLALIINNEPTRESGQHWLALYVPATGSQNRFTHPHAHHSHLGPASLLASHSSIPCVEFFDSFGYTPRDYALPGFGHGNFCVHTNTHALQSRGSNACGQFCLDFLAERALSESNHTNIRSLCRRLLILHPDPRAREDHIISRLRKRLHALCARPHGR